MEAGVGKEASFVTVNSYRQEKAFLALGIWVQAWLLSLSRVCWPQLPLKILTFIGADKQELIDESPAQCQKC